MMSFSLKATMKETFELHQFPFDAQRLMIQLVLPSNHDYNRFDLIVCMLTMRPAALEQPEWTVWTPSVEKFDTETSKVFLKVKRKSDYYVLNLFGLLTMFSMISFAIFMVPPAQFQSRMSILLSLLLTNVAFKFSFQSSCPKVGYSTHVDTFMFIQVFHLFFLGTMIMAANLNSDGSEKGHGIREWDYFAITSGVECFCVQVMWLLWVRLERTEHNVLQNSAEIHFKNNTTEKFGYTFCSASFLSCSTS